jgi:hypothetical protein
MRTAVFLFLMLPFLVSSAAAQDVHGRLEGRVVGTDGSPVELVDVTVRSASLQGVRQAVTTGDGMFTFRWLPVGTYQVEFRRIGYEHQVLKGVEIRLGRTATLGRVGLVEAPIEVDTLVATAQRKLIDPESTGTGVNLTPALYENLPVARDYRELALLTPLANGYGGTDLSVAGGTGPETRFFIEGTDVTDPVQGMESTRLPYNFVREVEIKTGGYEAEYRSSLGGIVNVVTYTGGNELKSQVFGFYTSDRFEGQPRYGLSETSKQSSAQYDVGVTLGGPVVRDKLWYFAAYNPSIVSEGIEIPEHGTYDDRAVRHVFAGKLTWQAAGNTNVFATVFGDPGSRDVVQPMAFSVAHYTPLNPETWLGKEKVGGVNLVAGATQRLGRTGLLEASFSGMRRSAGYEPLEEAGYEQQFHDHTNQTVSGGTTKYGSEFMSRSAITLKGTLEAGRHIVKAGGGYYSSDHEVDSFTHYVLRKYGPSRFAETEIRNAGSLGNRIKGLFVQDSWQVSDRWRLNAGVRWERQDLLDSNGEVAQTITGQWQPRLGVIFQPGRIGTQRLYGSVGRYYQDLLLNGAYHFNGEELYGWTFWDHDPRVDESGGDGGTFQSTISEGTEGVSGQHYDELIVGYERQIGSRLKLGARGMVRTLRRAVNGGTVMIVPDPDTGMEDWEYGPEVLGNPGFGALSQYPEAKREYAALVLSAEQTIGSGLMLVGSYVLSRTRGNYQGLFDTDYWSASPNANSGWYHPILLNNAEGLLPQDRKHSFKVAASYMTGIGLGGGARFLWQTGTPISILGGSAAPPMFAHIIQRGTAGRTPNLWDLDLRFVYDMRRLVGRGSATRIVLDVFNVGSPKSPLAYDENFAFTRTEEGHQADPNAHYMEPTHYQRPMMFRLGMEMGF